MAHPWLLIIPYLIIYTFIEVLFNNFLIKLVAKDNKSASKYLLVGEFLFQSFIIIITAVTISLVGGPNAPQTWAYLLTISITLGVGGMISLIIIKEYFQNPKLEKKRISKKITKLNLKIDENLKKLKNNNK